MLRVFAECAGVRAWSVKTALKYKVRGTLQGKWEENSWAQR
jgi:hypothetical protein